MTICADPDCSLHYGCRLRQKGVRLSAAAVPSRQNTVPPRTGDPAWERGVAVDRRPRGEVMPLLERDLRMVRVKEAGERRHEIDSTLRRLKGS